VKPPIASAAAGSWREVVFLVGLAGVFLVNAAIAVADPSEFRALVQDSSLGRWLDAGGASWTAPLIAMNDAVLGVALLAAIGLPRARPVVLAWSGVWLLVVTLVKVTALGA
jgi:hypothetical protein